MSFLLRVWKDTEIILQHAIAIAVTILTIWGIQYLLKFTLGEDAKLFDRLPIVYVCHLGDLAAMLRFCWKLIREA
jgi:hypothetical protein